MIKPTIGRVVWVWQSETQTDPFPALITKVWGDNCVNVAGFNDGGTPFSQSSIYLVQEEDQQPKPNCRAEWMPYQVGQAAKHEAIAQSAV